MHLFLVDESMNGKIQEFAVYMISVWNFSTECYSHWTNIPSLTSNHVIILFRKKCGVEKMCASFVLCSPYARLIFFCLPMKVKHKKKLSTIKRNKRRKSTWKWVQHPKWLVNDVREYCNGLDMHISDKW